MGILESEKRIDFLQGSVGTNPRLSTDYLFGEARGQMFGVLQCEDSEGNEVILRAFSCQFNGIWEVPDWAPPLLDIGIYEKIVPPVERQIKRLGREMTKLEKNSDLYREKSALRKKLSRGLMKEIHALYRLRNFRGETRSLEEAFFLEKGIPTGSGDCCAPKLLNEAARRSLKPLGISEFYWGKATRSGTRQHGQFYSSCEGKCQPILGFMLCGVEE
jgi:hypothetical protein